METFKGMTVEIITKKEIQGWIEFAKTEGIEDLKNVANSSSFWSDYAREGARLALNFLELIEKGKVKEIEK